MKMLIRLMTALGGLGTVTLGQFTRIADYLPTSDVTVHAMIDLDQLIMEQESDAFDFDATFEIYANGKHSTKSNGMRTLRGFSIDKKADGVTPKLQGEPMFDLYTNYWGSPTYADDFVMSAINGTGRFARATEIARSEGANKGSQYQNVWMYVIHELEDAILDCKRGNQLDNDRGVHAWDEGWAFYAGSLEGETGSGDGMLIYALAEKRCQNFGTCTADSDGDNYKGKAVSNLYLLGNFSAGKTFLTRNDGCGSAEEILRRYIIPQMSVPLIQGALRYAYLADPKAGGFGLDPTSLSKQIAEGWAFTAAVIPQVAQCSKEAATKIVNNMAIDAGAPVVDGYRAVASAFQSVYDCMGIRCSDIGALRPNPQTGVVIPECVDEQSLGSAPEAVSSSLSGGAIAGISIAVVLVVVVIIFAVQRQAKVTYDEELEKMRLEHEGLRRQIQLGSDGVTEVELKPNANGMVAV